jgi:nucleobase:cation symporter-1, NCS1 family
MATGVDASSDVGAFGGATPKRHGDISVEQRGIQPIEDDRRYGSPWRMFTVWFAPNVNTAALFLGAIGAILGLGMVWGSVAIVAGTVLGSIPTAMLCTWGPKTGAGQIPTARLPFGRTILLPAVVQWLSSIAWDALVGIFGGEALQYVFNIPFAAGVAIIILLEGLVAIWGHELIHVMEIAATVIVGALFIVLSVKVLTHSGLTPAAASVHGKVFVGAFILMITLSFSDGISWASYASDYSRYLPRTTSGRSVFFYTLAGLVFSYVWVEEVGLAAGNVLTNQTAVGIDKISGGGALGIIILLAIALATIASNAMNDYTGSLAMQTLNLKIRRPITAGVVMVLAYGLILWLHAGNVASRFEDLLLFASYWLSPFVAIVAIDWYHRRRNIRQEIQRITSWNSLHNEWGALIALLVGFGAAVPFMDATGVIVGPVANALAGGDTAYYVGLVVAAIVYIPLRQWDVARDRRRQAEVPIAMPTAVEGGPAIGG